MCSKVRGISLHGLHISNITQIFQKGTGRLRITPFSLGASESVFTFFPSLTKLREGKMAQGESDNFREWSSISILQFTSRHFPQDDILYIILEEGKKVRIYSVGPKATGFLK